MNLSAPIPVVALTLACFAAAVTAPMAVLLLAPLVLGVPHVAADVRFLVAAPGAPGRGAGAWLWVPLAGLLLSRLGGLLGVAPSGLAEWTLGAGGALVMTTLAPAGARRTATAAAATAALLAGWWDPKAATLVLGHLHNLIALGMLGWLAGTARAGAAGAPATLGAVALLLGAADATIGAPFAGLSVDDLARTLAPGLPPIAAGRLVASFAFLQLVHYATWVAWLPSSTDRRWSQDLGERGVLVTVGATAGLLALAWSDPVAVRAGYLSLVLFHGWLEVLVAAGALAGRNHG